MSPNEWTPKNSLDISETVDGINYRSVRNGEDAKRVVDSFFVPFLLDEPLSQSRGGLSVGEQNAAIAKDVVNSLLHGISFVAVDENTGEIVGFAINNVLRRADVSAQKESLSSLLSRFPEGYAQLIEFHDTILSPSKLFASHPDDNTIGEIFALSVSRGFRGRGVAKHLVRNALKAMKHIGCDSAVVTASSDGTRRVADIFGMSSIASLGFDQYFVDGKQYFANVKSSGISAHYLKL